MTAILHFINKWGHSCRPSDNRWGGFWRLSWRRFPSLSFSEGPEGKRAGEKAKAAEWALGLAFKCLFNLGPLLEATQRQGFVGSLSAVLPVNGVFFLTQQ